MPIGKESIQRVAKAASQQGSGSADAQSRTESKMQAQTNAVRKARPQSQPERTVQTAAVRQAEKKVPTVKPQPALKAEKNERTREENAPIRAKEALVRKSGSGRYEAPVPVTGELPIYLL